MALVSVPFQWARRMVLERVERIQCVVLFLEVPKILIIQLHCSNNERVKLLKKIENKNFINIDTIFLF